MTDWVLAIDYGTSFTTAATRVNDRVDQIELPVPGGGGQKRMPSCVFLDERGDLEVGWLAEHQAVRFPERFEPTPKRKLGAEEEVMLLGEQPVLVSKAVGEVLRYVLAEARRLRGGSEPTSIRLTHPASWAAEGPKVAALREAAGRAGIEEPLLLSEPESAALHFASERIGTGERIAVYDLGGGTFDTAVLEREGEMSFALAGPPGGKEGLGGEEFDRLLYEYVGKQLASDSPEVWEQIRGNPRPHRDFRLEVRKAKEILSGRPGYDLHLPVTGERNSLRLTREELESVLRPAISESVEILARTLSEAGIDEPGDPSELAGIYLAGGSSRIQLVVETITERLGRTPETHYEPKSVVALGAARAPKHAEKPDIQEQQCPHCGAAAPPEATFCGKCGRGLAVEPEPPEPAPHLEESPSAAWPPRIQDHRGHRVTAGTALATEQPSQPPEQPRAADASSTSATEPETGSTLKTTGDIVPPAVGWAIMLGIIMAAIFIIIVNEYIVGLSTDISILGMVLCLVGTLVSEC